MSAIVDKCDFISTANEIANGVRYGVSCTKSLLSFNDFYLTGKYRYMPKKVIKSIHVCEEETVCNKNGKIEINKVAQLNSCDITCVNVTSIK
jgi:hypothetical protein